MAPGQFTEKRAESGGDEADRPIHRPSQVLGSDTRTCLERTSASYG